MLAGIVWNSEPGVESARTRGWLAANASFWWVKPLAQWLSAGKLQLGDNGQDPQPSAISRTLVHTLFQHLEKASQVLAPRILKPGLFPL